MNIIELIKNNIKLYVIMGIIIFLGTIGVTMAVIFNNFNNITINTTSSIIDANITYDEGTNTANITNNGNMLPINDNLVTGPNVTDTRVLKVKFNVSGESNNPNNTIYDIAMYFDQIDCVLRTEDLKWRLYKNDNLLNEGNLSTTYDTMANNRLVLTNTQEDLTTSTDKYTFLLWISESCTGDITQCDSSMDQSKYLNKSLNGTIKVELATGSKKEIKRITALEESCDYISTEVPVCNNLTYNGQEQLLLGTNESSSLSNKFNYKITPLAVTSLSNTNNYTVNNNVGVDAGSYSVVLQLKEGYKWTDGSTDDKCIYCSINKKNMTVTTNNQSIIYGNNISSNTNSITSEGLLSGNSISHVSLSSNIVDVGTGNININNIKITDSSGKDITNNYNINRNNTGVLTITCSKTAEEPEINDIEYTGNELIGVAGGKYLEINGRKSATEIGTYTVTAKPQKNYCWSDGTTAEKTYSWKIIGSILNVNLINKEVEYTGKSVSIEPPTITNIKGNVVTDVQVSYKYYNGQTCTGSVLESEPVNAGNYSVKAYTEATDDYKTSESNCAKLTITKTDSTITTNIDTLSLVYPSGGSFTYNYIGDGTLSCSTSDSSIATCELDSSNKKVNITAVKGGNTTVILSASEGTNYKAVTKNVTVSVSYDNYTITLNNQSATSAGSSALYGRYANGIFLDSSYSKNMTTSSNGITVPVKTGYTFGGYYTNTNGSGTQLINSSGYLTGSFTNILYSDDVVLYAKWTANANTAYKVQHWQQNIDADTTQNSTNYTLKDTDNLTGTTGASITPAVKTYTGFTAPSTTTTTILADGSRVVNYYYTRNSYTVSLTKGTGIESVSGAGTYHYGKSVTINCEVSTGYTWKNWTGTHSTTTKSYTFTMPASNVNDTANTTVNSYKIAYTLNGGTAGSSAPSTGAYNTAVTISNPTKTGYSFTGWTSTTIDTNTAYYGSTKWSDGSTKVTATSFKNLTATNGGTVTLVANWTANSYSLIKVSNSNNIVSNGDFESYTIADAPSKTVSGAIHTWDGELNGVPSDPTKAYKMTSWGNGANLGVAVPEIGYHAHMRIINGNSVVRFKTNEDYAGQTQENLEDKVSIKNGTISTGRWLGVSQVITASKLTAGKTYTLTMDVYRVSGTTKVTGGLHYALTSNTTKAFNSGQCNFSPSKTGEWQTFSYTFTLSDEYLNTVAPSLFVYGYQNVGSEGELYVDNIRLEEVTATSKSYNSTYTSTEVASLSKTGYTFAGWYNDEIFTTQINTSTNFNTSTAKFENVSKSGTNAKIFAKWNINNYNIAYTLNGGTAGSSSPSSATYNDTVTISNPTKTGYSFTGWTSTTIDTSTAYYGSTKWSDGSTKVTATTFKNLTATNGGTVTLVANWNDITNPTCEITGNPTSWTKDDVTLTIVGQDNNGQLNANAYSWTSSTEGFSSTNTKTVTSNGTYTAYVMDATGNVGSCSAKVEYIDKEVPSASIEATSATEVKLTYSDNIGVTGYYFGTSNPASTNVSYTGINTTSGSVNKTVTTAGKNYLAVKDAAGNVTITDIDVFTISYNANGGGTAPASQLKVYGGDLTLSDDVLTRSGYKFFGWSTNQNATTGTYNAGGTFTTNADTTLYAVWRELTAYAVYSADDNSLTFYKNYDLVSAGGTYNGKAVTALYTGIETTLYDPTNLPPWLSYSSSIKTVTVADEISPVRTVAWFKNFSNCISMNLAKLDTSKTTEMSAMFYNCSSLTTLDISHFQTTKVYSMGEMFYGCSSLKSIDLSSFVITRVQDLTRMFYGCTSLTSLDLSSFVPTIAEQMTGMFYGCTNLKTINLSNFKTSSTLTDTAQMFYNCSSLTNLDVSGFVTTKLKNMHNMFYGCSSLTSLDLSNVVAPASTNMFQCFYGCSKLTRIDVRNIDFASNVSGYYSMFTSVPKTANIIVKDATQQTWINGKFAAWTNVTIAS